MTYIDKALREYSYTYRQLIETIEDRMRILVPDDDTVRNLQFTRMFGHYTLYLSTTDPAAKSEHIQDANRVYNELFPKKKYTVIVQNSWNGELKFVHTEENSVENVKKHTFMIGDKIVAVLDGHVSEAI